MRAPASAWAQGYEEEGDLEALLTAMDAEEAAGAGERLEFGGRLQRAALSAVRRLCAQAPATS
jgi:hypothetical protein